MTKILTEKQLHNRLNKYYKKHFEELYTDEWYVNPADNIWKFVRDGKTVILTCDKETGIVTHKITQ